MTKVKTIFSQTKCLPFSHYIIQSAHTATLMREVEKCYKSPVAIQCLLIEQFEKEFEEVVDEDLEEVSYRFASEITSLTMEETIEFVEKSPVFLAIIDELLMRGVDTDTFIVSVRREATRWTESLKTK